MSLCIKTQTLRCNVGRLSFGGKAMRRGDACRSVKCRNGRTRLFSFIRVIIGSFLLSSSTKRKTARTLISGVFRIVFFSSSRLDFLHSRLILFLSPFLFSFDANPFLCLIRKKCERGFSRLSLSADDSKTRRHKTGRERTDKRM